MRPATVADAAAITALEAAFAPKEQWSEAAWTAEIEADNRRVIVLDGDAGVIGVITVQVVGDVADLNRIVVAESARRRGLGSGLLRAGVEAAKDVGAAEMLLEVRDDNAAALALYTAEGFTEIARRRDYYPGADALVLRKELDDA